ncbi:MAG: hypothetical protein AB9835_04915 [Eubacteriales bacterium]
MRLLEKEVEDARKKEQQAKDKADAEALKKAEAARKAAEKAAEDARKAEEKVLADKAKTAADKAKAEEKAAEKAKKDAEDAIIARLEEYQSKRDDLEYYIDLDLITEAEYYEALAKLRDEYFEENTKEWRKITVAIYNFKREMEEKELAAQKKAAEEYLKSVEQSNAAVQKQIEDTYNEQIKAIEAALAEKKALYDEETKAIQESLKEKQSAYKAEYEAKRKQIDSELELERKRINTIIDAIDEEVSARRRLRETESADDKVTAAQKALKAAQIGARVRPDGIRKSGAGQRKYSADRMNWMPLCRIEKIHFSISRNKPKKTVHRQNSMLRPRLQTHRKTLHSPPWRTPSPGLKRKHSQNSRR